MNLRIATSAFDKENKRPSKQRVEFSPIVHRLQGPLLDTQTSSTPQRVLKGILKNKLARASKVPDVSGEGTPMEAQEGLDCPSYFLGPLQTLDASFECDKEASVSLHDIADAYKLLCQRIKLQDEDLRSYSSFPSLKSIQEYKGTLLKSFIRDISRALQTPITSRKQDDNSTKKGGFSEDEVRLARDTSLVVVSAIMALSDVLQYIPLYSIFTHEELTQLIRPLIEITRHTNLPVHNQRKIFVAVLRVVDLQNMPFLVISEFKEDVVLSLHNAIRGDYRTAEPKDVINTGLRTFARVMYTRGPMFLPMFVDTIPDILSCLLHPSIDTRSLAAQCLCIISLVLRDVQPEQADEIQHRISTHVGQFIRSYRKTSPASGYKTLTDILEAPGSMEAGEKEKLVAYTFVLAIMGTLILLSGPPLFCRPQSVKTLISAIHATKSSRFTFVRTMRYDTWQCLIFVYSQIPAWRAIHGIKDAKQCGGGKLDEDTVMKAYDLVSEEVGGDCGTSLVIVLLDMLGRGVPALTRSKGKAQPLRPLILQVIRYAIANRLEHRKRYLGRSGPVSFFCQLVDGIDTPQGGSASTNSNLDYLVPEHFFVGHLHYYQPNDSTLRQTFQSRPDFLPRGVCKWPIEEVKEHWSDIMATWKVCAQWEMECREDNILSPEMIGAWQTILLSVTELTQGNGNLSTSRMYEDDIIESLRMFVAFVPQENCDVVELGTRLAKLLATTAVLWNVMGNVFAPSYLQATAEKFLEAGIFENRELAVKYDLRIPEVMGAYERLYGSMLVWCSEAKVRQVLSEKDAMVPVDIRPGAWRVCAERVLDTRRTGEEVALVVRELLEAPLKHWTITEADCHSWGRLIEGAFRHGKDFPTNVLCDTVVAPAFLDKMTKHAYGPQFVTYVLKASSSWPESVFHSVRTLLRDSYPTMDGKRCTALLEVIEALRECIKSAPKNKHFALLKHVQEGIIRWTEDRRCFIDVDSYNSTVISFYSTALDLLRPCPIKVTLEAFSDLLTSVFVRDPLPSTLEGPIAFMNFCYEITARSGNGEDLAQMAPARLKVYAREMATMLGTPVPEWTKTDSQTSFESFQSPLKSFSKSLFTPRKRRISEVTPGTASVQTPTPEQPIPRPSVSTVPFPNDVQTPVTNDTPYSVIPETPETPLTPSAKVFSPFSLVTPVGRSTGVTGAERRRTARESTSSVPGAPEFPLVKRLKMENMGGEQSEYERGSSVDVEMVEDSLMEVNSYEESQEIPLSIVIANARKDVNSTAALAQDPFVTSPTRILEELKSEDSFDWERGLDSEAVDKTNDQMDESPSEVERCSISHVIQTGSPEVELAARLLRGGSRARASGRTNTAPAILETPLSPVHSVPEPEHPIQRAFTDSLATPTPSATNPMNQASGSKTLPAALENIHKTVVDAAPEMQTQELAQASKVVHQMAGYLAEQVARKLIGKRGKWGRKEKGEESAKEKLKDKILGKKKA